MQCPECNSGSLSVYYPLDGGPEPPRRYCWECEWSEILEPAEQWGPDTAAQQLERGPR